MSLEKIKQETTQLANFIFKLPTPPVVNSTGEYVCTCQLTLEIIDILKQLCELDNYVFTNILLYEQIPENSEQPISQAVEIRDLTNEHRNLYAVITLTNLRRRYALNFAEYLQNNKDIFLCQKALDSFCLYEQKYIYQTDNKDTQSYQEIVNYNNINKLVCFFKTHIIDHETADSLFIISREKINIPIKYNVAEAFCMSKLDSLISDIDRAPDFLEQRKAILKKVIVSMLSNIAENDRFQYLCSRLDTVYSRYKDNYYLFIEGIDSDKIIKDVKEAKLKYLSEANKLYTDLKNTLLTMPAAIIFVMTALSNQKIYPIFIVIAIYVYFLIMEDILYSQSEALESIGKDIKLYKAEIEDVYKNSDLTKKIFLNLKDVDIKICSTKSSFKWMYVLLYIVFGLSNLIIIFSRFL